MEDARDFEKPIREIEEEIERIRFYGSDKDREKEIHSLEKKLARLRREIYSSLTRGRQFRSPGTPGGPRLSISFPRFYEFTEMHGDRRFGDDPAIVAGMARFDGAPCAVIGHQKGHDTKERSFRNFGMPKPEGYRKALRVMKLAEKFGVPVITFIDTPGAYPGMDAEERGQAEAIAFNLREMAALETPVIATVTGEGGSGGALALGVADRVNILKFGIYSVISPEGCAAILYKDAKRAEEAAQA